jgi:undecaprenyl-phosphate 4-deoxy-4-formamido-L-arabinose transferase
MIVGFSIYPLRFVAVLGFFVAVLGILFGLFGTITLGSSAMIDPEQIDRLYGPRWLIRGSTLMAICIVGEYIGRIYRHLNRSPQFIIREKFIWPVDGSTAGRDACEMPGGIEPKSAGVREDFDRA